MDEAKEIKKPTKSKTKNEKVESQTIALNQLKLKVTNHNNSDLINETGNTIMCLLMQEDGKVLTSFMGDYNKEIIKTLERVNKMYFKSLKKQLFGKTKDKENNKKQTKNETK